MIRKKIVANTLVKNEGRFLWFSVKSVIDYVDKVLIWDTGSDDNTPEIAEALYAKHPDKISFKKYGTISVDEFPKVRQRMLEASDCDWILVLDGDEVWWDENIKQTIEFVQSYGDRFDTLVHESINLVGDIFHKRPDKESHYKLDGKTGSLNIRFMSRKIPGLHAQKPHGQFGYFNENNILIQDMNSSKRHHISERSYLHFTHLVRSNNLNADKMVPKRSLKLKYELGERLPFDFYFPEVFFRPIPEFIESPWVVRDNWFELRAVLSLPIKKFKNIVFPKLSSGY